ncbi:hypothetical protein KYJ26_07375 [Bacillus sp. MCCB 382]|uniref:hypothetical protein n=1 Tax=Bacillus sp. MCCB 382 TaxID=2860197 RepID=UPI001C563D52|nr:hypothetical protein [Bacillus sp. MCCB 382]
MAAKVITIILMLFNVLCLSFLVQNLIFTLTFMILTGMSIYYLLYEKEEKEAVTSEKVS